MKVDTKQYAEMVKHLDKLVIIKKLYEGYYNTNQYPEEFAVEFFYTIGEILQGKELKDLDLKYLLVEELP